MTGHLTTPPPTIRGGVLEGGVLNLVHGKRKRNRKIKPKMLRLVT